MDLRARLASTPNITLAPCLTPAQVAKFEKQHGVKLPDEYRAFVTTIAGGVSGAIEVAPPNGEKAFLTAPFPFSAADGDKMLRALRASNELDEADVYGDAERAHGGYIRLGPYSPESDAVLVVTGEERGYVWMVGNENFPAFRRKGKTLRRATFEEWLLDRLSPPAPGDDSRTELESRDAQLPGVLPTNLQVLKLGYSGIDCDEALPRISTLDKLESLYLPAHHVSSLAPLAKLKKLTALTFQGIADDGRPLTELPSDIAALKKLKILRVTCAKLARLPTELTKLTTLVHINVSSNELHELPAGIETLPKLKWLDVSNNPLDKKTRARLDAFKGKAHVVK